MSYRRETGQKAVSVILPLLGLLHSRDDRSRGADAVAGGVPEGYFRAFLCARASVRTSARAHYGVALFGWDQHLFVSFLSTFRLRLWCAASIYRRQAARTTAGMPSCVAKQLTRPIRNREVRVRSRK